ncbi:MAG: phosphotransferase, partial [Eubacterium sp.]
MEPLTKETVKTYLIEKEIFSKDAHLSVVDLHAELENIEGYVNLIYQISDTKTNHSVIVKQLLPYIRAFREATGEDHPILMERLRTEIAVLTFMGTLCEDIAPDIYLFDEGAGVIVMEDLSDLELLRFELTAGITYEDVAIKLGTFLALLFFHTSDLLMTDRKLTGVKHFFYNDESKRLYDILFVSNVLLDGEKPLEAPAIETQQRILKNEKLQKLIHQLGYKYLNNNECLIHNDLHSSNIMVGPGKVKIIDTEFSGYGPKAIDIGRLTGSMIINYVSLLGRTDLDAEKRRTLQAYDLDFISDLYHSFNLTLEKLWKENLEQSYRLKMLNCKDVCDGIFQDALQYSVISLITRISSD